MWSDVSRCVRYPGGFVACIWGIAYPTSAYRNALPPPAVLAAVLAAAVAGDVVPEPLPPCGMRVPSLSGLACVTA